MAYCSTEAVRRWRAENPERAKANARSWYLKNRDKHREQGRKWAIENPEKVQAYTRKHYEKNKEKIVKRAYQWHALPRGRASCLVKLASYRAKKKGLPFSIDIDDIEKRIALGHCEVTGLPFVLSSERQGGNRNPYSPSLDQIEAGKGYTKENTRVVCAAVNFACGTWGLEAFEPFAEAIIKSLQTRKAA